MGLIAWTILVNLLYLKILNGSLWMVMKRFLCVPDIPAFAVYMFLNVPDSPPCLPMRHINSFWFHYFPPLHREITRLPSTAHYVSFEFFTGPSRLKFLAGHIDPVSEKNIFPEKGSKSYTFWNLCLFIYEDTGKIPCMGFV